MHLLTPSLPHTRPFCSYIMLAFIHTLLMSAFLVRIYVMWAIIARYFQKFTVRSLGHACMVCMRVNSAMTPLTGHHEATNGTQEENCSLDCV